jgi:signal transduction histidine kinase
MSEYKNRRKLKNYLINPGFQLRLALVHTLFVVVVVVVLVAILLSPLYYKIQTTSELWSQYVLAQFMLNLMDRVAVVVLLIIIISAIYQIIFSHRLCGPFVNMNHTFDRLSKGDLTRKVFLRRKDFLKKEAESINGVVDALNKRICMLKKVQTDLSSTVLQLPEGPLEDHLRAIIRQNQALLDEWIVHYDNAEAKNVHDSSICPQSQA